MSGTLKTKDVSLTTFSVTIKALHIDSKKMTLATFKQLPKGDLYDEHGNIFEDINVWGYVSYSFDSVYYWAVYDYRGKLYRGDINLASEQYPTKTLINRIKKHIHSLEEGIVLKRSEIDIRKASIAEQKECYGEEAWLDFSYEENKILKYAHDIDVDSDQLQKEIKRLDVYLSMDKQSEEILNLQQLFIAI